jgi:hypothetical protein
VSSERQRLNGSFHGDLERLLEELGKPPIMELGKPLPRDKFLQQLEAARCPATHNRLLLDDTEE